MYELCDQYFGYIMIFRDDLLPGGAIEVCVRETFPDLGEQRPSRGTVADIVITRATFVGSRVKLPNDEPLATLDAPDESTGISSGRKGIVFLHICVEDAELDRYTAALVANEGHQARVASESQVGRIPIFPNDQRFWPISVILRWFREILLSRTADNSNLLDEG